MPRAGVLAGRRACPAPAADRHSRRRVERWGRFAGKGVDRVLVERLGLVVVAIDFRIAPADPYPATMQDVNYAARWVKAHAAELGGRADRVGAIGWSSGGHMAVLAALKPDDPRYRAIPL